MTPKASEQMLKKVVGVLRQPDGALPGQELLTKRERQVVRVTVKGYSCDGCAEVLGVTRSTLAKHRNRITAKTGLASREWAGHIIQGLLIVTDGVWE